MAETSVTLFESQSMNSIAKLGPESYRLNTASHDKCIEAGNTLLARLEREGMSDELDKDIAAYIEKAKITVRNCNRRRSPITQLFDQIRKVYTTIETEIDPSKKGTVPALLQEARNAYAARKREEAEAARRAEAARIAHDNAVAKYGSVVLEDYRTQFDRYVIESVNALLDLDRRLQADNYDVIEDGIRNFPTSLPDNWHLSVRSSVKLPYELNTQECAAIREQTMANILPSFRAQYISELTANRDDLLDRLPSKFHEIQKIAAADAEKAARLKTEMERREREEAARKEQERQRREAEVKAAAELQSQKAEMDGLFGAAMAAQPEYQPKTSVKMRLVAKNPEAFMSIVGLWWSREGNRLSVEELGKIFKRQLTYCEKLANDKDDPVLIASPEVEYVEEVKAK